MKRIIAGLFLGLCFLTGCSGVQPASAGDWRAFAAQLDTLAPQLLRRYQIPGAAVALVDYGEVVWVKGYGNANKADGLPVSADTVFQAASISKSLTTWGVMRLVEKGQLDLDAPAERYLKRWHLPPSGYDPDGVTLRRLLSHSAGLSVGGYPGLPPDQGLPSLEESLSGGYASVKGVRITRQPGAQYSYSGGGYTVLQMLIEDVTGEPFPEYMQREVLAPLYMEHSSFEWRADLRSFTAAGYDTAGRTLPNYLFAEKAAAGLYTTAADLARLASAEMSGPNGEPAGRGILSPAAIDIMHTPAIQVGGLEKAFGDSYGLGHTVDTLTGGSRMVGHNGSNRGWRSQYLELPAQKAAIVILTNSDRGNDLILDLSAAWSNRAGAGTPKASRAFQSIRAGVLLLAGGLAIGLAIDLARVLRMVRTGRRQWKGSISGSRPGDLVRRGVVLLVAASLAVFWLLGAAPVLSGIVSVQIPWLTAAVLAWCCWLALSTMIEPLKN